MKFKDKCDECGNYDYLKGYNGKCLCNNCLCKEDKQMTIYDILKPSKSGV